jgi:carotenoid 1,2-hydratase
MPKSELHDEPEITSGGRRADPVPDFSRSVPDGGYAWWYIDALSDDGRQGLTIIAFIGSVFSPYYAHARRRGAPVPASDHVAINAILYLPDGKRWSMTERDHRAVRRSTDRLVIGPSSLVWREGALHVQIEEITVPWPRRLRGRIRVVPQALNDTAWHLDAARRHLWQPLAPSCRVEVDFDAPELQWEGEGYLDSNCGEEPLEKGFSYWWWSRSHANGQTHIQYEALGRDGSTTLLSLASECGRLVTRAPGPIVQLPPTGWRVRRSVRADQGRAEVLRTLEDTPFYARSLLRTPPALRDHGHNTLIHETLDLDRFASRWVQLLLPFRMPRLKSPPTI